MHFLHWPTEHDITMRAREGGGGGGGGEGGKERGRERENSIETCCYSALCIFLSLIH